MWLIFALVSLFQYAVADIFGKKSVREDNPFVPIELCVSCCTLSFFIALALFLLGFGESGMAPWELLWLHPLIFVNFLCFFAYAVLYLFSMNQLKLSVLEAVSGSAGVFYFVGMILINLFLGKFPAVRTMLHPLRLIPVILVLVGVILYPSVNQIGKKRTAVSATTVRKSRRRYGIGLCFLLAALLVDSLDSILTALIIDEGSIGMVDYIMTSYFSSIVPVVFFSVFLRVKKKKWFIPMKDDHRYSVGYCVASLLSSQLFIAASYFDAVRTGILFLSYPIVPILGAKLFLKEKHTWRQNLCIWIITLSAIGFCALDYLL